MARIYKDSGIAHLKWKLAQQGLSKKEIEQRIEEMEEWKKKAKKLDKDKNLNRNI